MQKKITLKDFKNAVKKGMKVLHLDCETSPLEVYTFAIGKTILSHKQIKTPSKVLCVQYKWEGDGKAKYIESDRVNGTIDDSAMLEEASKIISQADIIIGQNIDNFDMKVLNGRLAERRLTPMNYDRTLDILKLSRQSFRFASQKLDFRSKLYGRKGKDPMELQDWIDVVEGRVAISAKMGPYGLKDVEEEQAVFYREFDYYKRIPVKIEKIIREFIDAAKPQCPKCRAGHRASFDVLAIKDSPHRFQCLNCSTKFKFK